MKQVIKIFLFSLLLSSYALAVEFRGVGSVTYKDSWPSKEKKNQYNRQYQFEKMQDIDFLKNKRENAKQYYYDNKNKLLTIRAAENVVRVLPPLNVKKNELDQAINIIQKVCKNFN